MSDLLRFAKPSRLLHNAKACHVKTIEKSGHISFSSQQGLTYQKHEKLLAYLELGREFNGTLKF